MPAVAPAPPRPASTPLLVPRSARLTPPRAPASPRPRLPAQTISCACRRTPLRRTRPEAHPWTSSPAVARARPPAPLAPRRRRARLGLRGSLDGGRASPPQLPHPRRPPPTPPRRPARAAHQRAPPGLLAHCHSGYVRPRTPRTRVRTVFGRRAAFPQGHCCARQRPNSSLQRHPLIHPAPWRQRRQDGPGRPSFLWGLVYAGFYCHGRPARAQHSINPVFEAGNRIV
jgi:hypothetical protein